MRSQYLRLFYLHAFAIHWFIVLFIIHADCDLSRNLSKGTTRMGHMLHRNTYILLRIRSYSFLMTENSNTPLRPRVRTVTCMIRIVTILTFIPFFLLALDNWMNLHLPTMRRILNLRIESILLQCWNGSIIFDNGRLILLKKTMRNIDGIFMKTFS